MNNDLDGAEEVETGGVVHRSTRGGGDIVASREVAADRVFKGGLLAVVGFGGALLVDLLNLSPGLPFWISYGAALTSFGAGAIWAGLGASHLIRHGKKGSSLWLISLTGLGVSVVLNVVSTALMVIWSHPFLGSVNLVAMACCGLFTAALIVLGLITIVRWILPDPGAERGNATSEGSEVE